jgi:DNA-binding transcriptional LysR family regulator
MPSNSTSLICPTRDGNLHLRLYLRLNWQIAPLTIYAIYPPTRHLAVKVRLFIDFLVERFSAGPEAGIGRSSTMDA